MPMGENRNSATSSTRMPALWRGKAPLILASKSPSRRALLRAAALDVEVVAPDVDERELEHRHFAAGGSLDGLAGVLARAKALAVSDQRPEAYCLGADQTLALDGRLMHKPRDVAEAAESLAALGGTTHRLNSAFCMAFAGRELVIDNDFADLQMRPLDLATIARYLDRAGPSALASVGAYQVEGLGVHLFDRIEGDHAAILGLPMLKLLAWLRRENLISL
jgi:septum formation protein